MIYWQYLFSELRRRKSRTVLTALGLGVGVGLVVIVSALSNGLDRAQAEVLEPLTGVGSDMTVARPVDPAGGGENLSAAEREQLEDERAPRRVGLHDLGEPGETFSRTVFMVGGNLSFKDDQLAAVRKIDAVESAVAGLTVSLTTVSGEVPAGVTRPGSGMGGQSMGPGALSSIDFDSSTVTGVDPAGGDLGPIQADQLVKGTYFSSGKAREAVVSSGYAEQEDIGVGDTVTLKDGDFKVVGVVSAPLGGSASDVYIKLSQLQPLADMKGRVNKLFVRAASAGDVTTVAAAIERDVPSAEVTTSQTLADRVGGSVVNARKLADKLGMALVIAALAASVLVAVLLTLSAVSKRTRELGTLKAIGWTRGRVVRQVAGESLAQGVLGGFAGAAIGAAGALAVSVSGMTMEASVTSADGGGGGGGPGGLAAPGGPLGRLAETVVSGTEKVTVTAPLDAGLILLAVAMAVAGGALAGMAGGMRAAQLHPAEALRHAE